MMESENEVPGYLLQYKKTPEELLNGRVLPPTYPEGHKPIPNGSVTPGRPAKYPCPEALQYAVDLYFKRFERDPDDDGPVRHPTIPGLVYALGFANKSTLRRMAEKGEEWEFIVDQAFLRIEGWKNDLLLEGGKTTQAVSFDLINNHGWSNKVEQTTNINPGGSLAELVQALQGKVLRPVLPVREDEEIEEAEVVEEAEEVSFSAGSGLPSEHEYAEEGQIVDDIEDLL